MRTSETGVLAHELRHSPPREAETTEAGRIEAKRTVGSTDPNVPEHAGTNEGHDMIASIVSVESCPILATTSEAEFVLARDVIFLTVADGSARLLDMGGSFHAMSTVGARMLRETLSNGIGAAVARIAEDYGVARQQVERDLTVFLRDLQSQGLL